MSSLVGLIFRAILAENPAIFYKIHLATLPTLIVCLSLYSGQINSLHYREDNTDKEYICSSQDSSGMHKCSHLPPFVQNGFECHSRYNNASISTKAVELRWMQGSGIWISKEKLFLAKQYRESKLDSIKEAQKFYFNFTNKKF